MMDFESRLKDLVKETEDIIYKYKPAKEGFAKTLYEAMNYSFTAGGKRLRPLIMHETFRAFGGEGDIVYPFMAALEMIHTYSLIHDDLPEMDNDDLRRGKPTNHVVYGQAMAVLAGDGLLNLAFETALKAGDGRRDEELARVFKALKVLAAKAGMNGMIGGQCVDVEAEKKNLTLSKEQLLYTYENKTAALLEASLMIGGILAGADDRAAGSLEKAGSNLGLAFQIQDDILDIESTDEELGKPVGSDEKNGKKTWISYSGLSEGKKDQAEMSEESLRILKSFYEDEIIKDADAFDFLQELIKSLVTRKS